MKWKLFCKIILKHGNEIIFKDLIQYMKIMKSKKRVFFIVFCLYGLICLFLKLLI